MTTKNLYRLLTALVSFVMLVSFSACSSDDAEDIIEEILPSTNVRAIHLSPDTPEVDIDYKMIVVEDTIVGLDYKEASHYTEISSGTAVVTIKRGSDGQVIGRIVNPEFAGHTDNTVYAVNMAADIEFIQSEDDRLKNDVKAKVRFVHASPDAPAVDVKTGTPDGTTLFSGAAFKDVTNYTTVSPGAYTFVITKAGDTDTAIVTFEEVTLNVGTIYSVVALGTLDDSDGYAFGVRVFNDSGHGNTFFDLTVAQ